MSDINSSFIPVAGSIDTLQDYEGFQYSVALGSPTNLGAITPTNPANAVQIVNCSPCPLKVTYTLQGATPKGGPAPAPETKEIVYKAGEVNTIKFDADAIVDLVIEEAVAAPADAITPDAGSAVNANASQDLLANIRFLNC